MEIVKVYFSGVAILIVAVCFNALLSILKVPTWYDVLSHKAEMRTLYWVILLVVYPFVLGLTGYLTLTVLKKII